MLSLVSGPTEPPLHNRTLGSLIAEQNEKHGDRTAAVFPQQHVQLTYRQLYDRSAAVGKSLLALGCRHGDRVGILAGNCYQYVEAFFGSARIGCPFVVLNNTYSPKELLSALKTSGCKVLFIAAKIGLKDLSPHLSAVLSSSDALPNLEHVMVSSTVAEKLSGNKKIRSYDAFVAGEGLPATTDTDLTTAEGKVRFQNILNLQFTSGTTGLPKAAELMHSQLINNARYLVFAMKLTKDDIMCCPPPLFHAFGLVMGLLTSYVCGGTIVLPSDQYDPNAVLDALKDWKCTVLHGVPTMFAAEVEANVQKKYKINTVRTGLVGGSVVPVSLMRRLKEEFGVDGLLIAYGMTETSPVSFLTALSDPDERKAKTVGRVMPHTKAKVIDKAGNIVPRGVRGELCISGYCLQPGYWQNPEKTAEVMIKDADGVLWLHTGDECIIDEEDYCSVTGRTKDIIIRGGENIFPGEISERLLEHDSIVEAAVVGLDDEKYGQVVSAFVRQSQGSQRPSLEEINRFVRENMGSHKAPKYLFWIGDPEVGEDFPKTGSGKIQMHILRSIGHSIRAKEGPSPKL